MNDELLVSMLRCGADAPEELEPAAERKLIFSAVFCYRLARHKFHHKKRQPFARYAAIKQARDMRVFEARENLLLAAETVASQVAIRTPLNYLDCDLLIELFIIALSAIDSAHSSVSNEIRD